MIPKEGVLAVHYSPRRRAYKWHITWAAQKPWIRELSCHRKTLLGKTTWCDDVWLLQIVLPPNRPRQVRRDWLQFQGCNPDLRLLIYRLVQDRSPIHFGSKIVLSPTFHDTFSNGSFTPKPRWAFPAVLSVSASFPDALLSSSPSPPNRFRGSKEAKYGGPYKTQSISPKVPR